MAAAMMIGYKKLVVMLSVAAIACIAFLPWNAGKNLKQYSGRPISDLECSNHSRFCVCSLQEYGSLYVSVRVYIHAGFFFFLLYLTGAKAPEFDYGEGSSGPSNWGNMKPEWAACGAGQLQSPVSIGGEIAETNRTLEFNYRSGNAELRLDDYQVIVTFGEKRIRNLSLCVRVGV
jgi:hypothetical protein